MLRSIFGVVFASVLISTAAPVVQAQAPIQDGFRAITSPRGYQFQVPSAWRDRGVPVQLQIGGVIVNVDDVLSSPDGAQDITPVVEDVSGVQFTSADLPDTAKGELGSLERRVVGDGGTHLQIFVGPNPVTVTNANAAVTVAAAFSDKQGIPYVFAILIALRGQTVYSFIARVSEDFYVSDPSYPSIMSSFQLVPATSRLLPPYAHHPSPPALTFVGGGV